VDRGSGVEGGDRACSATVAARGDWRRLSRPHQQPAYRSQPAEGRFNLVNTFIDITSYAEGEAFWAEVLGPLGSFRQTLHDAELRYEAFNHDAEAQNLAFAGVLSRARLDVKPAPPDFDSFSGSFNLRQGDGRLSIGGSWTAVYGGASDRFDAASRYSFEQLQTYSGHLLTGSGTVFRERIEQHDPFEHQPLLNSMSVFNYPTTVSETTRRSELYNESFNGALVNQSIQRALADQTAQHPSAFIPPQNISLPVALSAPQLYHDQTVKRPPYVSNPPPEPPRPEPAMVGNVSPPLRSPPQVNGVLMKATVINKKPADKVDTRQIFDTADGK
jgi:hypothetical protein